VLREPSRWLVTAALTLTILLATSGLAQAAWSATASGSARAQAISMPGGSTPSAAGITLLGVVDLTIPLVSLANGTKITSYNIYRQRGSNGYLLVTLNCGTPSATQVVCRDGNPGGLLIGVRYRVAPRLGNWVGAQGGASNAIFL